MIYQSVHIHTRFRPHSGSHERETVDTATRISSVLLRGLLRLLRVYAGKRNSLHTGLQGRVQHRPQAELPRHLGQGRRALLSLVEATAESGAAGLLLRVPHIPVQERQPEPQLSSLLRHRGARHPHPTRGLPLLRVLVLLCAGADEALWLVPQA